MRTIERPAKIYASAPKAEEAANLIRSGEDEGWEYRVIPDPKGSGKAIIKVYDEDGEFVGDWSI